MKNYLFIVLLCVSLFSCSTTSEQKLLNDANTYMKTEFSKKLKDPASFEKVDAIIFDTVFVSDLKSGTIEENTKTFPTGIASIKILYTYRAKNGFGALDVYETTLRYFPTGGCGGNGKPCFVN